MKLALQTCQTVDDFQAILDSTSIIGDTRPAIYGVIDAVGGASIFETFPHSYVRYDASDTASAPLGILVRANFSYAGDTSSHQGLYRHDRAKALLESAASGDSLSAHFICRTVARDLRDSDSLNPYPLPFEGQLGNLPWGFIKFSGAISNMYTASACIVEGALPEENPALATFWAFPMAVEFGVALPFWAVAGNTPPEVDGFLTAPLCDEGIRLKTLAQKGAEGAGGGAINTYFLVDERGGGLHPTTFALEDCGFHQADSALVIWRATNEPDSAGMAELTAQLAQMTYTALLGWPRPGDVFVQPHPVVNLTANFSNALGLVLRWPAVRKDLIGLPMTASGYEVWRYADYPLTVGTGDSLGFTSDTVFVVERVPAELKGFFDVRTVR